jgi:hypothetical protein
VHGSLVFGPLEMVLLFQGYVVPPKITKKALRYLKVIAVIGITSADCCQNSMLAPNIVATCCGTAYL